MCECCNPYAELDAIIRKHKHEPGGLKPVMQEAQRPFGALTIGAVSSLAHHQSSSKSPPMTWRTVSAEKPRLNKNLF